MGFQDRRFWIVLSFLLLLPAVVFAADTSPEGTSLRTEMQQGGETVVLDLPLRKTEINSQIDGFLANVEVQQTYTNPYDSPVEAIYTFPLPNDASVHEMIMKIGDRLIIGELKEKEQARKEYEEAKEKGQRASLLEQERPNVFTQSVANIMPGDTIQIVIRYSEILDYEGGEYTSVIPAVVGPRYTPGTPTGGEDSGEGFQKDTDRVPDASRVTPRVMGPGVTSTHRLDLRVTLDAGFPISELSSPSHDVEVQRPSTNTASITLHPGDTVPNKDFILNYKISLDEPMVSAIFHRSFLGGFVSLILQPQTSFEDRDITPKDLIFILDKSGSMNGKKIATLRDAVKQSIGNLRADDRFKLIAFDNNTQVWKNDLVNASRENKEAARRWAEQLSAGGGTNMLKGLDLAMAEEAPGDDRVQIMLFVTDGLISNDDELIESTAKKRGKSRVFTMGIGSSPNRHVLEEMAAQGRGSASFVRFDEEPERKVSEFFSKISNPYLVDLKLEDPDGVLSDVLPSPLPDLFIEEPLYIVGKFDQASEHPLTLKGKLGGEPWSQTLTLEFPEQEQGNKSIARLWARKKIEDYMRSSYGNPSADTKQKIIDISTQYQVMSDYTSFVAVEKEVIANPDTEQLKTQPIPVELPEGMRPEGVPHALVDASSSVKRSKPGDPLLSVDAPATANDVIAHLPGYGREFLDYNTDKQQWETRFVLPRDFRDDVYPISVKVIDEEGNARWKEVTVAVDSLAPQFDVKYLGPGEADSSFRVLIDPIDVEILNGSPVEGIDVDIDIRRFSLYFPDGSWQNYSITDVIHREDGRFEIEFEYDAGDDPFELRIEAMDWARNRYQQSIEIKP